MRFAQTAVKMLREKTNNISYSANMVLIEVASSEPSCAGRFWHCFLSVVHKGPSRLQGAIEGLKLDAHSLAE